MTNRRWQLHAGLLAGLFILIPCSAQTVNSAPAYRNPKLPISQRVSDLVSRMTLQEKVSQMVNDAPAIPRLGVPAYNWWSEGLHGIARSGYATMFPQAIGMAATFDTHMVGEMGVTTSIEARAKYNQALRQNLHSIYFGLTIWAPNINILRDPRWGRGQETYGEDPFLTSRMATAYIKGLQGDNPRYLRAVATPKHYAVHSGPEPDRHHFNVNPSPYDLNDTYLPAFRASIMGAHADSVMCAYSAVDGVPDCASKLLLQQYLRKDWGFTGFVTSDCDAIADLYEPGGHHYSADAAHASAAAVEAGTDTNCGNTYLSLTKAVKEGLIPESAIDQAVKRLFTARFRLGMFDPPADVPYDSIPFSEVNSPAHRALALQAARESMVLLKNEKGVLPLHGALGTIAVVGPNAASLPALEGNYNAIPSNPVLPLDGIEKEFPAAKVLYAQGAPYAAGIPTYVPRTAFHPSRGSTQYGLKAQYFASSSFSGNPVLTRIDPAIQFDWDAASPVPGAPIRNFAVRWTGTISVPEPGDYPFSVKLGHCRNCDDNFTVDLDGKQAATSIGNKESAQRGRTNPEFILHFADTRPHAITVEYIHHDSLFGAGITLRWRPPAGALLSSAVAAARKSDVVLAFVGLSPEMVGEEMPVHVDGFSGGDRTSIDLPEPQRKLLQALAATGKPLVVVLMNGDALAVDWAAAHAQAILEAWYPGEAGGQAIAETLAGKNNPAGRLPITFYASTSQLPPFTDYSMRGRTYRYFKGKPLYGFGYGLSYTTFTFSSLHLSSNHLQAGDKLGVEVEVHNSGKRAGDEVAELYLTPPKTSLSPIYALKGFARVHLTPGETRKVRFTLTPRLLSQVNAAGKRSVEPGNYLISVGGGQPAGGQPAGGQPAGGQPADVRGLSAAFVISGSKSLPN